MQTLRLSAARRLVIADAAPPAVFGEMALVGQCMYHCSAQTMEPSRIRTIRRSDLETLLDRHAVTTRRLLDLVSERFVRLLLDLEGAACRVFAGLLMERARRLIDGLSHKEQLHVSRESVATALGELCKGGIIAVGRKRIRVLDRGRLERAAREE